MTHTNDSFNEHHSFTYEELKERVAAQMSDKRFKHVLGVEETALLLAEKTDVSLEKVRLAALLHDYAKERADDESRDIIISENMDLEMLQYGNNIWHGPVGAVLVKKECRIEDEEILAAIARHTIGAREMTTLDKIIFIADYIEPGRNFPVVEKARALAGKDLDEAVKFKLQQTMLHLLNKKQLIYPQAIEIYNAWVPQKTEEKE